jgi:hypothetical protein
VGKTKDEGFSYFPLPTSDFPLCSRLPFIPSCAIMRDIPSMPFAIPADWVNKTQPATHCHGGSRA